MTDKTKPNTERQASIDSTIASEIARLLKEKKLSNQERLDLYAIVGHMNGEGTNTEYNEFLYMYLMGDRDWKKDFKSVFGREAGKIAPRPKKKFDVTKVRRAVVKKKK